MNHKNNKIPFLKKISSIRTINRIQTFLRFNDKPYIITITSITNLFNDEFNIKDPKEEKEKQETIEEVTDLIHNLMVSFKQPYFFTKKTIREILNDFLPFTFFVSLSDSDAMKVLKSLKSYEESGNGSIKAFVRKEAKPNFSIITWTSNFFRLNRDFYSNFNQEVSLNFFDLYSDFINTNFDGYKYFPTNAALEVYGTRPIVLLSDLRLEEALYTIFYFQSRFNNLPFDFLLTDTRSLKRQKNKVKPAWIT